jgi:hypothetical protein
MYAIVRMCVSAAATPLLQQLLLSPDTLPVATFSFHFV